MVLMNQPAPPPPAAPRAHSVVCETHGLRYNPATHDGCVRCRRERGEVTTAPPRGPGVAAQAGSLGAAVGTALGLIAVSGSLMYWDDLRTWKRVQELRESGNYIEGLTPEQQEQFEQLQQHMERMFGDAPAEPDEDGEE